MIILATITMHYDIGCRDLRLPNKWMGDSLIPPHTNRVKRRPISCRTVLHNNVATRSEPPLIMIDAVGAGLLQLELGNIAILVCLHSSGLSPALCSHDETIWLSGILQRLLPEKENLCAVKQEWRCNKSTYCWFGCPSPTLHDEGEVY